MKKSELRKLIRQAIKEQIGPYPGPPKKDVRPNVSPVNPNQIGPATPILGYNCVSMFGGNICQPVYDIPANAGVTPPFATLAECMQAGCGGPGGPGAQGMSPSPRKRGRAVSTKRRVNKNVHKRTNRRSR